MKKILLSILGLVLLGGCTSSSVDLVKTKQELKYKKILVMPFTKRAGANATLAQDTFISELSLLPDIEIIGNGQMDETTIKNLGVTHSESFGSLDFASSPEGDERRKKVLESFKADAIVFGSASIDEGLDSLVIQMMDATSGDVILSFSKEASIPEGMMDDVTRELARKSAQKTTALLQGNVVITNIHRR